jgi:hypothetical protein
VQAHGVTRGLVGCALVLVLLIGGLAMPARLTDGVLQLWGVGMEGYAAAEEQGPLPAFVRECFSWWWLIAAVAYVLPVLLLPLAASFAPSQVLWLRLTPCSSRAVMLARTMRLLLGVAFLAALALPVVVLCTLRHDLPAHTLLDAAAGVLAHTLWAGGLVLVIGPSLKTPPGRALAAFVAFLTPLLSFVLYAALAPRLPGGLRSWWPYALPFAPSWGEPARHVLAAAALGAGLVALAVLRAPGRCESLSPFSPQESMP